MVTFVMILRPKGQHPARAWDDGSDVGYLRAGLLSINGVVPQNTAARASYQVVGEVVLLAVPSDHRRALKFQSCGCSQADRVRLACPSLFSPAKKA